jgi:hypothetical protein
MNKPKIVLLAFILQGLGFVACTSHVVAIPEGIYKFEGVTNKIFPEECNKTKAILGETLIIDNDSLLTSVLHETDFIRYPIIRLSDSTYFIYGKKPLSEDTISVKFIFSRWNNQLRFCEDRMVYLKKK